MLTLVALVDSFGIWWSAYIVSRMVNTTRDFVETRRYAQHDRDAYSWARVWARCAAPSTTTTDTYRLRASIR